MSISSVSTGSFNPTMLYQNIFNKVDGDESGGIDKTEFKAAIAKMTDDQDVSSDELDAMFSKLDTNGDGKVDETEMLDALKSSGEARHAKMQAMGAMPPPPPPTSGDSHSTSNAAVSASSESLQNVSFADLIKSLQFSDKSGEDVAFSDLINSLKSSSSSDEDEDRISSLFNSLIQDLMNSTNYSSQGSLSVNTTTTSSFLSLYA
jgi:Ca2+-binding EF-hand superfamily protein